MHHTFKNKPTGHSIICGYDQDENYVFMTIFDSEANIVYSNLDEEKPQEIKDFRIFEKRALDKFKIIVPEDISIKIRVEAYNR